MSMRKKPVCLTEVPEMLIKSRYLRAKNPTVTDIQGSPMKIPAELQTDPRKLTNGHAHRGPIKLSTA